MAYVSEETLKKVRAGAKDIAEKYGIKMSFSGKNDSALRCKIASGKVDFGVKHKDVNTYHIGTNFNGVSQECLEEILKLMKVDYWNKSDYQSDYFNCAYYMHIQIGSYDRPYLYIVD